MSLRNLKVGFIGFGNMASVICQRILETKLILPEQIYFVRKDRDKAKSISEKLHIHDSTFQEVAESCDFALFGIKPQHLQDVFNDFPRVSSDKQLYISMVTGKTIESFQRQLGENAQIMRIMPNVASQIGEGVTAFCQNENVSKENLEMATKLLSSLGLFIEVEEAHIDIVTATFGSGPAFVFKLIDVFAKTAQEHGINESASLKMAAQTFLGAAKLIMQENNIEKLVDQVAAKGGTTEAGLKMFESNHIHKNLQAVIEAALLRARELSK